MIRLLILADDFTGGLDTGVQFASRGVSTCVMTDPMADFTAGAGKSEVLVVVAETRHLPPEKAYEIVCSTVRKGLETGIPHIYKKTDSALRGNIGAELAALLEASGEKFLPFIPAYPAMNRVTREGIHYIDGVPVADSVFGRDPFEPVTESDVARLIAAQSSLPAQSLRIQDLDRAEGIAVLDAETEEDLHRTADALKKTGAIRIGAGCAGFAAVLPEMLELTGHRTAEVPRLAGGLLVLCGSVNPITQCQLDYGERHGYVRIHLPPEDKLHPEDYESERGQELLAAVKQQADRCPWLILDANDPDPSNRETADKARELHLTTEEVRQRIAASLGHVFEAVTGATRESPLLITGGDTLLQGMNRMKVTRMFPIAEVYPGVVLSRVTLHGKERLVMTKSGGFGAETLLADLKALMERTAG